MVASRGFRTCEGSRSPAGRAAGLAGRARFLAPVSWVGGTLLAAVVLMVCYLRIAGTVPVTSDGAGNALQAWDMLHGNLLLHGWWVTDVSFYTTELPQYALVEAAAGLRPEVVHICAAMTYTLLVLLAAYVARGRARGAEGVVRAVLAAGVMLAPEPGVAVQILLSSPDHVGTAVPVLLLLLLLDRGRPSWWQPVAAFVVLSVAIVGDPLTEVIGVLPLAVLCLARIASALLRRRAPLRSLWHEISLGCAAVAAVAAAEAAKRLIVALHGFSTNPGNWSLVSLSAVRSNIPMAARNFLSLFGADVESARGGLQQAFAVVHLAGAALVVAALVMAAARLMRSLWSREQEAAPDGAPAVGGSGRSGQRPAPARDRRQPRHVRRPVPGHHPLRRARDRPGPRARRRAGRAAARRPVGAAAREAASASSGCCPGWPRCSPATAPCSVTRRRSRRRHPPTRPWRPG